MKYNAFNEAKISDMKFTRLQTWYVCRMHADPNKSFPEPNAFMPIGDEEERVTMTAEERRAKMQEMRKFKMK